jgi:4,5-dihydroxyphthalate decarboxylase
MSNLSLTMACGPYDRFEALRAGIVRPEGIDLTYLAIQSPPEIFAQVVKKGSFDISEMSLSMYITLRARQGRDFPFIAIPVFPLRMFRHGYIFVNRQSEIKTPKDLEGKRVGVPEYRQTAAVWIRGLLQHEYGVSLDTFNWYEGGANKTRGHDPTMDLRPQKEVSVKTLGEGKTLSRMLAEGEIDAMIGARRPDCLGSCPDVTRLFPNYRQVEREYYTRAGIFPIMHILVIRESLYEEKPWIAESIYKACEEAKSWCLKQMRFSGALRYMLPWLFADIDELDEVFGSDPWPYGIEPNRPVLETLIRYLVDQSFLTASVTPEEMFAPIVTWNE